MARIALVSGASSGIGRAAAIGLAEAGYIVHICGRRADALDDVAAAAPGISASVCDVTDAEAVERWVAGAAEASGRIDVVFNNAGVAVPTTRFGEIETSAWRNMVEVNLNGAFNVAQASYRVLRDQTPQGGRIINNGSISAQVPRPGAAPYTATKHAITGLTKAISLDGRAHNIACSQIDIGNVESDMTRAMASGILQANGQMAAEPRFAVKHVVDAILYMAGLPLEANVQFMTVMATAMPYIGRG